jgi:hypothetical protein
LEVVEQEEEDGLIMNGEDQAVEVVDLVIKITNQYLQVVLIQ